ncbi:Glycoside hydrolase family 28 protein [Venustampulla echinocandica]|uniref:Glycoside hydrolase family 28 protein n=1 Tax=Venustampulla echinocandica TaxID=2656787 RepID=A0A370U3X3_9HELO|nr:Glycoside hydrolase family 28 protein [Venustampulla echinocandica]RDL42475.1 Glycoside hydrolase family 28 protein [Venustampulla echinocandica]
MLACNLLLSCLSVLVSGAAVSYPRPSIYDKSAKYTLKVNGTYMYTVSYAGYDYVQLSMDQGHATEFRISAPTETSITSFNISPKQLPITATTSGNELVFSVSDAHYLIITINNLKEFVIMADPSETNVPPSSGNGIFNVLNYGADNTGSDITTGVQSAMDAAAKTPGSIVYVPPGLYYIGNLMLRSQTSLYLAGGSVLRFTGNKSDYTTLFTKSDVGPGTWWIQTEFSSSNIKVYGRGTIDGNGYFSLYTNTFIADLLVPVDTTSFTFDGPLIRDSSFWAVTPIQSQDVSFKNLKILNRQDVGQDDGIDVIESTNVRVTRAIAVALDDSFSTKTWPLNQGTTVPYPHPPMPLSDVVFDNCLAWTVCYGYKIGQGVYTSQKGVVFKNSVVYRAAVGLGIDHRYGTEIVSNVTFDTIDIESLSGDNAGHATWLAFFVESQGAGIGPIDGVKVNNIRVRNEGKYNGLLVGYNSSAMVSDITFSDVYMLANTTPATTLGQMKILDVAYTSAIVVQ